MRLLQATFIAVSMLLLGTRCLGAPDAEDKDKGAERKGSSVLSGDKVGSGAAFKSTLDLSKPYGYHLGPILDRIKANSEQRVKITAIVQGYRSKIEPLRDEYKEKQQEFISSMISGSAAVTIMDKQVELGHLATEITSKYCLMKLEVRRTLSPQQILDMESYGREQGWNH